MLLFMAGYTIFSMVSNHHNSYDGQDCKNLLTVLVLDLPYFARGVKYQNDFQKGQMTTHSQGKIKVTALKMKKNKMTSLSGLT